MISADGVYDIPMDEYNADPCPQPSLRSSISKKLLVCPRKAGEAHPKLNHDFTEKYRGDFDLGSAAHDVLGAGDEDLVLVDAKDWRTKVAKEKRDEAYEAGRIPLLTAQYDRVQRMVEAAREQIKHTEIHDIFDQGEPEKTIAWSDGDGTWFRARPDWLIGTMYAEYKTTAASAHPQAFTRQLFNRGYDSQAELAMRGLRAVGGGAHQYRCIVQEVEPPYLLSVIGLSPMALSRAERNIESAIKAWKECMATGKWPAYPTKTAFVDPPAYLLSQDVELESYE